MGFERLVRRLPDVEHRRDLASDEGGLGQRGEVDEEDTVGRPGTARVAASTASLVLPTPPTPVRTSRRTSPSSRSMSASSASRPMKLEMGAGRLCRSSGGTAPRPRVAGSPAPAAAARRRARGRAPRRAACAPAGRSRARPSGARHGRAPASAVATASRDTGARRRVPRARRARRRTAERQVRLDPSLDGREPDLHEPIRLSAQRTVVGKPGEWRPAPEAEAARNRSRPDASPRGQGLDPFDDEPFEPDQVDAVRRDDQA